MLARRTTTGRFQTMTAAGSAVRTSSVPARSSVWAEEAIGEARPQPRKTPKRHNPRFVGFIRFTSNRLTSSAREQELQLDSQRPSSGGEGGGPHGVVLLYGTYVG